MASSPPPPPFAREGEPARPPGTRRAEMDSETGLELPSVGRTLRLFGRALLLRCPHCAGRPVLRNWMNLRVKCGTCSLRLQRGEHDTMMGSVFILFTLIGLFSYAVLTVAMLVTRTTPWSLLEYGLPALVLAELALVVGVPAGPVEEVQVVRDLNEPDAPLDQPTGQQAALAELAPVRGPDVGRLAIEPE